MFLAGCTNPYEVRTLWLTVDVGRAQLEELLVGRDVVLSSEVVKFKVSEALYEAVGVRDGMLLELLIEES